jgi:glucokinase
MSGPDLELGLVGDVGGTNVRFALADISEATPRLLGAETFLRDHFATLEAAIEHYLHRAKGYGPRPRGAILAVAGPVTQGSAALTNGRWRMSVDGLQQAGFAAQLINDYEALALSVRHLRAEDLGQIGPAAPVAGQTAAILGAGTGLGVAAALDDGRAGMVAATEGGHTAFAPSGELEIEILRQLAGRFGRVSLERILSGPGLVNLHWALGRITGREGPALEPEEIVTLATQGDDVLCVETLDRFCAIYGAAAGDLALVYGARGGIYLGGGIAPRLLPWLRRGTFRARFEAKGRFAAYVQPISTQVILHPYAALLGAATALRAARPLEAASAVHVA